MDHRLQAFKPAASARGHLLLAALMWTVVGAVLVFFGVRWTLADQPPYAGWLLAAAFLLGLVKAQLVLKRAAARIVARIRARGDGRCLGGFVSLPTWGLILGMMIGGRVLRGGILPSVVVGLLYAAIGTALLAGARWPWRAWYSYSSAA